MKNVSFHIIQAQHAPLYARYDLKTGGFVTVGDYEGTFGREDSKTGASYKALGGGRNAVKYPIPLIYK